jgi:hypothetical protein
MSSKKNYLFEAVMSSVFLRQIEALTIQMINLIRYLSLVLLLQENSADSCIHFTFFKTIFFKLFPIP